MAGRKSARRMSKCIVGICVVLQFAFVIQYGPSLFQNSFHWRSLRLGGGRVDGDDNATTVATKAAAEAVTRTAMTPTTPPTTTTTESTAAASSTVVDDNENVRMPHPNVKLEWEAKEFMRMFGLACKSSKKPVDPNACPCTPPRLGECSLPQVVPLHPDSVSVCDPESYPAPRIGERSWPLVVPLHPAPTRWAVATPGRAPVPHPNSVSGRDPKSYPAPRIGERSWPQVVPLHPSPRSWMVIV